jgi:hypothetical protein
MVWRRGVTRNANIFRQETGRIPGEDMNIRRVLINIGFEKEWNLKMWTGFIWRRLVIIGGFARIWYGTFIFRARLEILRLAERMLAFQEVCYSMELSS